MGIQLSVQCTPNINLIGNQKLSQYCKSLKYELASNNFMHSTKINEVNFI
jgi:hypothetical protein